VSGSIVAATVALREALCGFDADVVSGAECARLAGELAATEKACAGVRLLAAARAVSCKAHEEQGFNDGAEWLATQAGISPGEAKRNLHTAARLGDTTKEALRSGKLSLDQAEEITNTAIEVPHSEEGLVDLAQRTHLTRLREEGRDLRLAAMHRDQLHERQRKSRSFRHWRNELGMVCFRGALTPEDGVGFVRRIEREAFRLRKAARQKAVEAGVEVQAWEAYAADAFVDMISNPSSDTRSGRSQTDLVIVCDLRAWRRGHAHPGEPCHILDGGPIPPSVAKELAEDAFLSVVLHDGVEIATLARFGRHIPAHLRAALDIGDPPDFTGKKCADCHKRHGLQIDHVDPVANGGPTRLDNLQPRCWKDHQAKTERDRQAGLLGPHAPRPPNTS
jgi:hypothetical protein